jgi:hypothetical protein
MTRAWRRLAGPPSRRNSGRACPAALRITAVVALVFLGAPLSARSCGFDGVFEGSLGVPHPRSIEIALAVRRAVAQGQLPQSALDPVVPDAAGLWRAKNHLDALRRRLAAAAGRLPTPLAVLLAEAGLWTRLMPTAGGFASVFHATGAQTGDTAVITDEAVIAAILDGSLSVRHAFDAGLIVIDTPPPAEAHIRDLIGAVFDTGEPHATAADLSGRTPWGNERR